MMASTRAAMGCWHSMLGKPADRHRVSHGDERIACGSETDALARRSVDAICKGGRVAEKVCEKKRGRGDVTARNVQRATNLKEVPGLHDFFQLLATLLPVWLAGVAKVLRDRLIAPGASG